MGLTQSWLYQAWFLHMTNVISCIPQIPTHRAAAQPLSHVPHIRHPHMTSSCLTDHQAAQLSGEGAASHYKLLSRSSHTKRSSTARRLYLISDQRRLPARKALLMSHDSAVRCGRKQCGLEAAAAAMKSSPPEAAWNTEESWRTRDAGRSDHPARRKTRSELWHVTWVRVCFEQSSVHQGS